MNAPIVVSAARQNDADWPNCGGTPPFIWLDASKDRPVLRGTFQAALGTRVPNVATCQDEGVFANCHLDGQQLNSQVDPLGFFNLFVYQNGSVIALSPSPLA